MTFCLPDFAATLRAGTPIAAADVLAARRWAWSDGGISPAEADGLFELNMLARDASPEWIDFFVEAQTEYVVNRLAPRGYIDEANAAWLIAAVDRDGRVDTAGELELLVKVLETALNAPASLKDYVLRQIEAVVLTGEGPTRRGGDIRPGRVDEAEVVLLRRLIFAPGGDGALVVSAAEAEMLWRLKDATLDAVNAPGWRQLFVQGVGNYLMAYSSYRALERPEAQRLETLMAAPTGGVGSFLSRMLGSILRAGETFSREFAAEAPVPDHDAAVAAEAAITPDEQAWLTRHIDADGRQDPLEEALLAFVAAEAKW